MIGLKADEGGASFWVGILNILRLRKHSTKSKSNLLQYFTKMEGIDIFFLEAEQGDFLIRESLKEMLLQLQQISVGKFLASCH